MKKYLLLVGILLLPATTQAHCPLCTAGAGALAILAASLGVSTPTVGVFIGAFALALALWFPKLIKKKYFPQQDFVVATIIFLSTIIPLIPLIREYRPLYISLVGEYGSLLHNTYTINIFLVGAVVGAFLLYVSPRVSKKMTEVRGRTASYQGLSITFGLLIIVGVVFQLLF